MLLRGPKVLKRTTSNPPDDTIGMDLIERPASRLTPGLAHGASDYHVLSERIRGAGLLQRRPGYYSLKIGLTITGFALGWLAFFLVGNSWATLGIAVLLAVLFTQVVFLGHDAGHQQISNSRHVNRLVGLLTGNALTGLSFGWWIPKHNAHHAYPNQIGRDPDLGGGLIAFAVTPDAAEDQRLAVRLRARLQIWLSFVLLLLQGLGLHVTSVQHAFRRRGRPGAADGLLLAGNAALYLTAVFWVLSPLKALAFIGVQQGLFGLYLGSTFAPNHKGMPVMDRDATAPYLQRQVATARNVIGGRFVTLLFGGLNYQIEHHLFPSMPRPNLSRAQHIVEAFCMEHDLPYRQMHIVASYRQAFRTLGTASENFVAPPAQLLSTRSGAGS
jgi:fatty acid desaturase